MNLGDPSANPYVRKADAQFYNAYCQAKLALLGDGERGDGGPRDLNDFLRAEDPPELPLLGNRQRTAGRPARLGSGRYAAGRRSMYTAARQGALPRLTRSAPRVLLGKTLQSSGQARRGDRASSTPRSRLQDDESAAAKAQRQAAQLGKAVSLAATGDVKRGPRRYPVRCWTSSATPIQRPRNCSPQAYNALGSCYLQAGKREGRAVRLPARRPDLPQRCPRPTLRRSSTSPRCGTRGRQVAARPARRRNKLSEHRYASLDLGEAVVGVAQRVLTPGGPRTPFPQFAGLALVLGP